VPVPPSLTDDHALAERLTLPHLEMTAWPGAVPCARHHARQLLWDLGLKELIEPVELVVSEIVTNAVQACGGLDTQKRGTGVPLSVVRLWLVPEPDSVLVLVWDGCPLLSERQAPGLDDDNGRGLLLVETLSAAWGSFELAHQSGKVVWALCQG
jgi:anti-sigma regulatory factor (Ser/Thr protein kinase)